MRTRLGISIVLAFLFALWASAQEDCATCHEEQAKAFGKTIHGRASTNCESCHIGAQEHAAAGGEKKPAEPANACLSCHEAKGRTHWQGSAHQRAGLTCTQCHDPHADFGGTPGSKSAVGGPGPITQKCLTCHGQMRAVLHQRSSHPLRDGQMECSSCHDPHGSSGEKMLRQASVNDLCYTCHQNLRGPFLWEHSPVREDCLTCHRAHGSNYPQLLQARISQLCQSCHQQGRHQTIPGVSASIWNSNRACVNCHSQIHGTNHPSGPLFQR